MIESIASMQSAVSLLRSLLRPPTLDGKDWRKLQSDLRKTPRDFDLAGTLWDGPVLSEHLRRRYGVDLGVRQCQRLFRELGLRLRKPRPQVAQSDRLKVAAANETPASGSTSRRRTVESESTNMCLDALGNHGHPLATDVEFAETRELQSPWTRIAANRHPTCRSSMPWRGDRSAAARGSIGP